MRTEVMKVMRWMLVAVAIAAMNSQLAVRSYAGLFKIDFGQFENEKEIVDADGNPTGTFPEVLTNWNVIATWTFVDPNANVVTNSASILGATNADGTEVTWKLTDFSTSGDNDVTLTMLDNKALAEQVNADAPPYLLGQTANNPVPTGQAAVYDGILVPAVVRDDYLYRNPDTAGTEVLMRFANLNPGAYNVTVFEGRTNDTGRFGKVWVDDIKGAKEPAAQNTGNYAGVNDSGVALPLGQPRTVAVEIKAGEYLWFAEMEDNSGGISGMIIRSVAAVPPPIDVSTSKGLFKIDFGQFENERVPTDADGNPTGPAPDPLKDWVVIPTWTFADPNANVVAGSASATGTANADGTEVTWKLIDASKDANTNVTMTMLDNKALAEQLSPDSPPYMMGQTANNPTKDGLDEIYDGVLVPAIVKDDYNYRLPDTAGTEALMRFAGLNPGTYNVTVFEGRTTDANGRFGKVWVDDISGAKEPAAQNTGNYAGVNVDVGGIAAPAGNPQTVAVNIKAGDYLWFAEMEDNSGGISGMIIRGTGGSSTVPTGPIKIGLNFGTDATTNSTLAATDVAGVPAVAQANWNNNSALSGTNKTIVADANGTAQPTTVSVVWDSNNTWASTGKGEENNKFPVGADRTLMTGYLDTGDSTTSHVTITSIPSVLTSTGYDLYVYALGGVAAGRAGGYRIVDPTTKAVLKDYVLATSNTNPTNYVEVPQNLAAGVHGEGNYIVFRGLTASNITLEATTVAPQGSGTPPRAPVNAVQLVPAAPSGPKFTGISKQGNNVVIQWTPATAVLQSATLVTGPYTDVGGASGGTYSAPLTDAPRYFRLK